MVQQCVGQFCFTFIPGLPVIVEPKNVQVSSDVGILPIQQFDDQIGLTERLMPLYKPRVSAGRDGVSGGTGRVVARGRAGGG